MRLDEAQTLDHGVYRLFWMYGGSSLAAVGSDATGTRWFAPTNWIAGLPCTDWSQVVRAELIPPPSKFEVGELVKYIDQPVRPLQVPIHRELQWGVISSRSYFPSDRSPTGKKAWHYAFGPGVSLWYDEKFLQKLSLLERIAWEAR